MLEEMCCFRYGAGLGIVIFRYILWSHVKLLLNQLCILKDSLSACPEDFIGDPDPNYNSFLLMMAVVLSLYILYCVLQCWTPKLLAFSHCHTELLSNSHFSMELVTCTGIFALSVRQVSDCHLIVIGTELYYG